MIQHMVVVSAMGLAEIWEVGVGGGMAERMGKGRNTGCVVPVPLVASPSVSS